MFVFDYDVVVFENWFFSLVGVGIVLIGVFDGDGFVFVLGYGCCEVICFLVDYIGLFVGLDLVYVGLVVYVWWYCIVELMVLFGVV